MIDHVPDFTNAPLGDCEGCPEEDVPVLQFVVTALINDKHEKFNSSYCKGCAELCILYNWPSFVEIELAHGGHNV